VLLHSELGSTHFSYCMSAELLGTFRRILRRNSLILTAANVNASPSSSSLCHITSDIDVCVLQKCVLCLHTVTHTVQISCSLSSCCRMSFILRVKHKFSKRCLFLTCRACRWTSCVEQSTTLRHWLYTSLHSSFRKYQKTFFYFLSHSRALNTSFWSV